MASCNGRLSIALALAWGVALGGCQQGNTTSADPGPVTDRPSPAPDREAEDAFYASLRALMVREQIEDRGIEDPEVLRAMRAVPRHLFVPPSERARAYDDHPLPIGLGQTISQPYIVALMTAKAGVREGARVYEVGTGSGYQAAVLAEMGCRVFTVELEEALARQAEQALREAGYAALVSVRVGDGYRGWPEEAPFDAILVTAAPDHVPEPLYRQLAMGGRMVIPVGPSPPGPGEGQELLVVEKTPEGRRVRSVAGVRFVPMRGEAERGQR